MAKNIIENTKDFMVHTENYKMLNYFLMNRLRPCSLGVFVVAAWNDHTSKGGKGFMIVDSYANILYTGSGPISISWMVEMETAIIISALEMIREWNGRCAIIYTSSNKLWKNLQGTEDIN